MGAANCVDPHLDAHDIAPEVTPDITEPLDVAPDLVDVADASPPDLDIDEVHDLEDELDTIAPPVRARVYAHSSDTLYAFDPNALTISTLSLIQGCSSVVDLAANEDGELLAATSQGLYEVNPDTGRCTPRAEGFYPNSLAFIPPGILDEREEALVGYAGGEYRRFDPHTGDPSTIGLLGSGLECQQFPQFHALAIRSAQ